MAKAAKKKSGNVKKSAGATAKKRTTRESWSKEHLSEIKKHSKAKTPVDTIAKALGRTAGALRQKAYALGLPLGHRR